MLELLILKKLRKIGLMYVIISSSLNTSIMDVALCCQDPIFSNDEFIPQLLMYSMGASYYGSLFEN